MTDDPPETKTETTTDRNPFTTPPDDEAETVTVGEITDAWEPLEAVGIDCARVRCTTAAAWQNDVLDAILADNDHDIESGRLCDSCREEWETFITLVALVRHLAPGEGGP